MQLAASHFGWVSMVVIRYEVQDRRFFEVCSCVSCLAQRRGMDVLARVSIGLSDTPCHEVARSERA